ncbi:MAG: NAD(P)/FAD-dependent oxidoreductase [Acidimicrobiales bacterium]
MPEPTFMPPPGVSGDAGTYDVAIIGGGITGCSAAYHLARSGARVVLLERFEVGTEASGRNAGSLHGQIPHEPYCSLGEHWARSFLPALQFLLESLERWRQLSSVLGSDLEVVTNGGLLLVENSEQLRLVERKVELERSAGLASQVLSRADVVSLAPYVSDRILGAGYSPVEGKANPMLAAPAFAAAAAQAGAEIRPRTRVVHLEATEACLRIITVPGGEVRADRMVLASGNELAAHARHFGAELPISTEPVQVSATEPVEPVIGHLIYFAGARLTLKQARAGSLLIGGGWPARLDPVTGYPLVNVSSLRDNLAVAIRVSPRLADVLLLRSWAGIGNGTPDHRPILGPLGPEPRVLVGLFPYMGLTAGPLMGEVLAELALGRQPSSDISSFSSDRFLSR